MKVDVQKVTPCRVKVIVKAEADETRDDYEHVVKTFMRLGSVAGFRQGKAPRDIIKRQFHDQIMEEVHDRLIRRLYKPATEQAGLKRVNLLDAGDVLFSPETGISFSMVVDVEPEFDLPKYRKIKAPREEVAVTDEEVEQQLNMMREAFAHFEDAPEGYAAQAGDLACIDYAAQVEGRPLADVAPEAHVLAEGKNFWMQVEAGKFLPELVEAVKGMRAGETQMVTLTFPDDQPIEALRNQQAVYTLTVMALRCRMLLSEDTLLAKLKIETPAALREKSRAQLEENARQKERRRRENAVVEQLLKKADFDLPESEVSVEVSRALDRLAQEAHYRGLTRDDLEAQSEAIIQTATDMAKRTIRLRYILARIADEERIVCSDEEVTAKIAELARENRIEPEALRSQMAEEDRLERLQGHIRSQKTMEFLLNESSR